MTIAVPIALIGWIPAVLLIFWALPPRRAMIVSFLLAWLFLPPTGYFISGLPDYTKASATSLGALLATLFFSPRALTSLRPRWLDLPMLVWCLCPFVSSMSNGLGAYDGISAVVDQSFKWGLPYLFGRAYLKNLRDLRELAILLFIGGLIYVPFCLWEIRMSPNLGRHLYGLRGAGTAYFEEFGVWGSRPHVFMRNALAAGMFMTAASLTGIWMWRTGSLKRLWGFPTGPLVLVLVLITIGCKNVGALSVLVLGLAALFSAKWFRTSIVVYLLVAAVPLFIVARATGKWAAEPMVDAAALIHEGRAASLQWRIDMDDILAAKALERPVFGWGGWGRARVYRESDGKDIVTTDGLWIIALGNTGIMGLTAVTSALLLPVLAILWRYPARLWTHPAVAPCAVLAVLAALYMIDNLFNAMLHPIYLVTIGGLVSVAATQARIGVDQPRRRTTNDSYPGTRTQDAVILRAC